ncbi:hypothetical protein [Trueperella sp. LYQ141]|uniref:hypothetical protein n=1 Tax=Trueperella sp. LYQ141 TaxID=3391058 RepID=UPI0039830E00
MVAVVFAHGRIYGPMVWRAVADYLPPTWAVAAPFLAQSQPVQAIARDIAATGIDEPIYLVAEGLGAIPALEFADSGIHPVAGIFLSGPSLEISGRTARYLKATARLARHAGHRLERTHAVQFLDAVSGRDVRSLACQPEVGYRRHVVVAEKDSGAVSTLDALEKAGWSGAEIAQAQWDWFDYAPVNFAAHVRAFITDGFSETA